MLSTCITFSGTGWTRNETEMKFTGRRGNTGSRPWLAMTVTQPAGPVIALLSQPSVSPALLWQPSVSPALFWQPSVSPALLWQPAQPSLGSPQSASPALLWQSCQPSSPLGALGQPSPHLTALSQPSPPLAAPSQPSPPLIALGQPSTPLAALSQLGTHLAAFSQPGTPLAALSQSSPHLAALSQASPPLEALSQSSPPAFGNIPAQAELHQGEHAFGPVPHIFAEPQPELLYPVWAKGSCGFVPVVVQRTTEGHWFKAVHPYDHIKVSLFWLCICDLVSKRFMEIYNWK